MQIFVSGTWSEQKAAPYQDQAIGLGRLLAEARVDLACGPGTGIARHVIDGYRAQPVRGRVRYYLPDRACMAKVGEVVQAGADDVRETRLDYPMRNVFQVQQSDGLFVLTGGDGTLEEALPALIDYGIPVAVLEGAGSAATALRRLLDIYPEWNANLTFGTDVARLAMPFIQQVRELFQHRRAGDRVDLRTEGYAWTSIIDPTQSGQQGQAS